jgi:hypothetical protein
LPIRRTTQERQIEIVAAALRLSRDRRPALNTTGPAHARPARPGFVVCAGSVPQLPERPARYH